MYVEAILMETMRFSSFTGQGAPHAATEDTKIGKYNIPKVCITLYNHTNENHPK